MFITDDNRVYSVSGEQRVNIASLTDHVFSVVPRGSHKLVSYKWKAANPGEHEQSELIEMQQDFSPLPAPVCFIFFLLCERAGLVSF
jgi:hypothetical protein